MRAPPLVLLLLGLAACSGGAGTPEPGTASFASAPLSTLPSDSGRLAIEVRTGPTQPPARGELEVQLIIRDAATQAPATGLDLSVTPWMPAMAHGTSVTPDVTETAPGVYLIRHVDLFMPGSWQLRTDFHGSVEDHATPSLPIP